MMIITFKHSTWNFMFILIDAISSLSFVAIFFSKNENYMLGLFCNYSNWINYDFWWKHAKNSVSSLTKGKNKWTMPQAENKLIENLKCGVELLMRLFEAECDLIKCEWEEIIIFNASYILFDRIVFREIFLNLKIRKIIILSSH